jgi:hypothetical protein
MCEWITRHLEFVLGIGIPLFVSVVGGGVWMCRWWWPLKITVPKARAAYSQWEFKEHRYIIMVYNVVFYARTAIVRKDEYISIKGNKARFLSCDSDTPKPMESGNHEIVNSMKFDINIDFDKSPLSKKSMKGRIVIGRCKSAYFDIPKAITVSEDGIR